MTDLIAAGDALAEFAREVAVAAVRASGDVMDGAEASELVCAWEEAADEARIAGDPVARDNVNYALGHCDGLHKGSAVRDELLDLGSTLVLGFAAALQLIPDDPEVPAESEMDFDEIQERLAAANGACNRIHTLVLEHDGQMRLSLTDTGRQALADRLTSDAQAMGLYGTHEEETE